MIHRTKENKLIPICSMDNVHLINTIKMPFKAFQLIIEDNEVLSYAVGKTVERKIMTPEIFNRIQADNYAYWIEALKRDTTRNVFLEFIEKFNPIFRHRERFNVGIDVLNENNQNREDEIDYDDEAFYDTIGDNDEFPLTPEGFKTFF